MKVSILGAGDVTKIHRFSGMSENDVKTLICFVVGLSIAFNSKSDELKKVATHIVDSNNLSDIIKYLPK